MKFQFVLILILLLVLLSCKSNNNICSNKNNCKQEQILLDNLAIIQSYVYDSTFVRYGEMNNSSFFLGALTGIESSSISAFFVSYSPNLDDYNNWYQWYQIRKDSICHDFYKHRIDSICKIH